MKFGVREFVFLAVLAGMPVAAWWFVFRPSNARNAEMLAQIESRQTKLQALNKVTATLGDMQAEIGSLEEAIKYFHSKLPSEKEIDKVLQEAWRLAEKNQLTTKSIRTLKCDSSSTLGAEDSPYAEQPISMQLEGPFSGFYGFLLALEAQPRIMRVQKMSIEKPAKGEEGWVKADCVVSVFFERSAKD
jgi:Tfp pilus assembly protein PilO